MKLSQMIESKMDQWNSEAELNFARLGKTGTKMVRQLWANGQWMVGFEGALSNQCVTLERAIAIFRAGWKVYT